MERKKNDNEKELDESIRTHIQSILQSINVDLKYGTTRLWRQGYKWYIGATGEGPVTNAHANKINLSYDVTGIYDVNISQPKKKSEQVSSILIGEV